MAAEDGGPGLAKQPGRVCGQSGCPATPSSKRDPELEGVAQQQQKKRCPSLLKLCLRISAAPPPPSLPPTWTRRWGSRRWFSGRLMGGMTQARLTLLVARRPRGAIPVAPQASCWEGKEKASQDGGHGRAVESYFVILCVGTGEEGGAGSACAGGKPEGIQRPLVLPRHFMNQRRLMPLDRCCQSPCDFSPCCCYVAPPLPPLPHGRD